MKRGARLFYLMGVLILILTVWTSFEIPWRNLSDELGWIVFLSLIVSASVGLTEIAVGWLVGLHLNEEST